MLNVLLLVVVLTTTTTTTMATAEKLLKWIQKALVLAFQDSVPLLTKMENVHVSGNDVGLIFFYDKIW